jgi:hypothetical protein
MDLSKLPSGSVQNDYPKGGHEENTARNLIIQELIKVSSHVPNQKE